jgi:NAD(P)-dependent dehydrogenase (short-subunit alcohol dehydrogenase family)
MSAPILLVTGVSRGIGAATAKLAAGKGYDVALSYVRDQQRAEAVAAEIRAMGRRAAAIRADVGVEADIVKLFAEVDAQLGTLDVLVVNSGVTGKPFRLADAPAAQIREVIDVNVTGAILCAREGVRRMSTRLGGKGGSIVLVSSRATDYGSPGEFVWYPASKGAINAFCLGLSREVGREGIRVNAVSPGPIDTEMLDEKRRAAVNEVVPLGRIGRPEEVGEAILFLASSASSFCTGANISVSGGR